MKLIPDESYNVVMFSKQCYQHLCTGPGKCGSAPSPFNDVSRYGCNASYG